MAGHVRKALDRVHAGQGPLCADQSWCPRQDSNLRTRLRRAVLYPLSYGGRSYVEDPSASTRPGFTPTPANGAAVGSVTFGAEGNTVRLHSCAYRYMFLAWVTGTGTDRRLPVGSTPASCGSRSASARPSWWSSSSWGSRRPPSR